MFAQPSITSFTAGSGPVGTPVTLSGNNFSTIPANNIVYFGAVRAAVLSATSTSLVVEAPAGTTHQPITVTTDRLTASAAAPFLVTFEGGSITAGSFAVKVDFTTGPYPSSSSINDLDGDGKADLVVANRFDNTLSVFRNTGTGGAVSLAPKIDLATGPYPYCVSAGDFDGDGKPDLATANYRLNTISLFQNTSTTGSITFAPRINLTTGFYPTSVAAGDIDGDGKPDLATVNTRDYTFSILRNTSSNGIISFAEKIDFVTGTSPYSVCIGDLDGDGKPELAVTIEGSNTISIYKNTSTAGSISLASPIDYATGSTPHSASIGDLNNDGKPDLAIANAGSNIISVFKNTGSSGNISFSPRKDYTTGNAPDGILIADLDGDAKPDLNVVNLSGTVWVFKNTGTADTIAFGSKMVYSTGIDPIFISVGDLNADGKPDIAVPNQESGTVSIIRNMMPVPVIASFTPLSAKPGDTVTITGINFTGTSSVKFGSTQAASFTVVSPTAIAAVVGEGSSGNVSVTSPRGIADLAGFTFIPAPAITAFSPTVAARGTTVTITGKNFIGTTSVGFGGSPAASFNVVSATSLTAVVGDGSSGSVTVSTSLGTASKAEFEFIPPPVITLFTPASAITGQKITITGTNLSGATAVTLGNMPAASFTILSPTSIEAVVGAGASGSLSITTPGGTATIPGFRFASPTIFSFTPGSGPVGTTVRMKGNFFDAIPTGNTVHFGAVRATVLSSTDTSLDVIVPAGATYSPVSVRSKGLNAFSARPFVVTFQGSSPVFTSKSFEAKKDYVSGANPYGIALADLDGDGRPDMIVANDGNVSGHDHTISVHKNTSTYGAVSLDTAVSYQVDSYTWPYNITAADLDGDGKLDIAATDGGSGNVLVYRNTSSNGTISLAPFLKFSAEGGSSGLSVGDLDGDGKPDIVTVNTFTSTFTVLRNISTPGTISFAPKANFLSGREPAGIAIADLDGDDKPDLAIANNSTYEHTVSVYRNTSTPGSFSFAPRIDYSTGSNSYPTSVSAGDINGDGKPDLAVSNYHFNTVSVFKNISAAGTVSFDPKVDFSGGNYQVSMADVDGDGKIDLGISYDAGITVLQNISSTGTISFSPKVNYTTGNSSQANFLGDLDGDGKPELIAANSSINKVSIWRNVSGEPKVAASGTNPVSGNIIKKVIIAPSVLYYNDNAYVERHYDIEPLTSQPNATATVTLYFTQQEFDRFNAYPGHGPDLPKSAADNAGKAALRVYQYHGSSTTGQPGSYPGAELEINPDDNKIVWDSLAQWWAVTVDINGFSGFFAGTAHNRVLPLNILSFTANQLEAYTLLRWTTSNEVNIRYLELQGSSDGMNFISLTSISKEGNNSTSNTYQYIDKLHSTPVYYYRLKITNQDNSFTYSNILSIKFFIPGSTFKIFPNPANEHINVEIPATNHITQLALVDFMGRTVKNIRLEKNTVRITIPLTGYPSGIYNVIWSTGTKMLSQTVLVKLHVD